MNRTAAGYLLLGQLCLIGSAAICYLLLPQYTSGGGGASNYGVHRQTIVFFSFGLLACGISTSLAAQRLAAAKPPQIALRRGLWLLAALLIAVLLSTYPYKLNAALDVLHRLVTIALFVYEILLGGWLVWHISRRRLNYLLFIVQLAGSLLAVLSLLEIVHLLFIAQLIAALSFGALLVLATAHAKR